MHSVHIAQGIPQRRSSLHHGVQTQAAADLRISERVLRYKLKKWGLEGRSA